MMPERRKKGYFFHDIFDDMFKEFESAPVSTTFRHGRFINEDDYEITPKKHIVERKLKAKEDELETLKLRRKNDERFYDEKEKALSLEIDQLKTKLSP